MKRLFIAVILLLTALAYNEASATDEGGLTRIHEMLRVWDNPIDFEFLNNDTLLVSTSSTGLRIVDMTDPGNPCEAGLSPLDKSLTYFSISQENSLLLGTSYSSNTFMLYDITDIYTPGKLAEVTPHLGDVVTATGLFDSLAFVSLRSTLVVDPLLPQPNSESEYESGVLAVYNISDPTNLTSQEFVSAAAWNGTEFRRLGDTVYFLDETGMIEMVDISDPDSLKLTNSQCAANSFDISGDYICVGRSDGLHIFDATLNNEISFLELSKGVTHVVARDHIITIMQRMQELGTFDVSDPANIRATSWRVMDLPTSEWKGWRLLYHGGILCALSGRDNLNIIDVSDSSRTLPIATLDPRGWVKDVVVDSEREMAWVSIALQGMLSLDISLIDSPAVINKFEWSPTWMVQVDTLLYFASANFIKSMSIVDTANPILLDEIALGPPLCGLQVRGNKIFTAGKRTLYQIDCSDAENLVLENSSIYDTRADVADIEVDWPYAYLSFVQDGLYCIDLEDPEFPIVSIFDAHALDCEFYGDRAYIAAGQSFIVADFSDPAHPELRNKLYDIDWRYCSIAIAPPFAYLGDLNSGITAYSFADPQKVHQTASSDGNGEVRTIVPVGDYLLTTNTNSFTVYNRSEVLGVTDMKTRTLPDGFELISAYPNPFNSSTSLTIHTHQTLPLSISVYNLIGRRVFACDLGQFTTGTHTVTWDGKSLASGVYFLRLESGNRFGQIRRITLLR